MNCKFTNVLVFAAGALIGSAVTWKLVKTKYETIAKEEIESVKAVFSDRMVTLPEQTETQDASRSENTDSEQINWDELEDLEDEKEPEYRPNADDQKQYRKLANVYTSEKGGAEKMAKEPYVIAPYDFGELDGYSQIELTYYADEVLEDDEYNIVTDADKLLGPKALYTFGEYEEDAVFVRNEQLRADFQILKDYRTYAEARSVGPGQVDDE